MKIGDLLYNRRYNSFGIITDTKDNIYFDYYFYHWDAGVSISPKIHYGHIMEYWRDAQKMRSSLE